MCKRSSLLEFQYVPQFRRALLYIGLFQGGRGWSSAMKMAKVLVVLSCLVPKASVITSE